MFYLYMVAPVRFELTHVGVRVQCLTAWPWGNKKTTEVVIFIWCPLRDSNPRPTD